MKRDASTLFHDRIETTARPNRLVACAFGLLIGALGCSSDQGNAPVAPLDSSEVSDATLLVEPESPNVSEQFSVRGTFRVPAVREISRLHIRVLKRQKDGAATVHAEAFARDLKRKNDICEYQGELRAPAKAGTYDLIVYAAVSGQARGAEVSATEIRVTSVR